MLVFPNILASYDFFLICKMCPKGEYLLIDKDIILRYLFDI